MILTKSIALQKYSSPQNIPTSLFFFINFILLTLLCYLLDIPKSISALFLVYK